MKTIELTKGKVALVDDFNLAKDAALAYNEAAIRYHKEFASPNKIGE
jgi:hypothetical protein